MDSTRTDPPRARDEPRDDRQAYAAAVQFAARRQRLKDIEHAIVVGRIDPRPVVPDGELVGLALILHRHFDAPLVAVMVLERIANEVAQHGLQRRLDRVDDR